MADSESVNLKEHFSELRKADLAYQDQRFRSMNEALRVAKEVADKAAEKAQNQTATIFAALSVLIALIALGVTVLRKP